MSFVHLPSRMKQSPAMHLNLSCKPTWLKTDAYEFPNYASLHPNLNNQVALILYYAHIMDQKKLLKDFFRLCKNSFENKYEPQVLESAVKTWIKHSIVKLHRRREQIISNAVTTYQIEMIRTLSQLLISIFWDILRESSNKVSRCCGRKSLSKRLANGATVTNQYSISVFNKREVFLPKTSHSKNISACISEWGQWFMCLPFQENKNLPLRVSENNPIDWLRKFWLTFCYQPDPTNSIYKGDRNTSINMTTFNLASRNHIPRKTTVLNQTSENHIRITATDLPQSCIATLTESNLKYHNKNLSEFTQMSSLVDVPAYEIPPKEDSTSTWSQENSEPSDSWSATTTDFTQSCIAALTESNLKNHNENLNEFVQMSCSLVNVPEYEIPPKEDSTSTWSQENSESSGSWSAADFEDEMPDDVGFNSFASSSGISHDQCNSNLLWMEPSSSNIEADFDSDDRSIIFGDVITEENCMERGGTNGSLYFIDTDDDDDFDVIFSESSAATNFQFHCFEDKSQGYDNPCFEVEFRSPWMPKYLRTVNESWNEMMLKTEDKPRRPSKVVSFAPEPSLVKIYFFEKTDDNSYDPSAILDRMRFQRRINELNYMLAPFFTCEHRKEVVRRNCFYQDGFS